MMPARAALAGLLLGLLATAGCGTPGRIGPSDLEKLAEQMIDGLAESAEGLPRGEDGKTPAVIKVANWKNKTNQTIDLRALVRIVRARLRQEDLPVAGSGEAFEVVLEGTLTSALETVEGEPKIRFTLECELLRAGSTTPAWSKRAFTHIPAQ